jgi:uncharacterized protein YgiM (DUF1202 family)
MKRKPLILSTISLLVALSAWAAPKLMSVQVREGQLRTKPSYLSRPTTTLSYGERVDVLNTRQGWVEVKAGGTTGWIHESALTRKKIIMTSGSKRAGSAASSDEVALAGRGFNAQVEAEFQQDTGLDFGAVDAMEKESASDSAVMSFLEEGGVKPPDGGGS